MTFHAQLNHEADLMMGDIRSDLEADGTDLTGYDFGYECYTDSIPTLYQDDFRADEIGVVYAGELGTWFFVPGHDRPEMVYVERGLAMKLMPRIFGSGGIYAYEGGTL